MRRLQVLQVNMGRRRLVTDELRALAREVDIMVVQEPCCRNNVVVGFGLASRVVALGSGERRPRAAIVVVNPALDVMELRDLTTADQAACYVKWGEISFTLVSSYMPPRPANLEEQLAAVEAVALRYRSVIVCSDTNSWSTAWGSVRTDARGRMVEESLARCQLVVMNEPSGPTFVGARGHSWIDVTLATSQMVGRIADWTLRSDTSSDHRVIAFSVVEGEGVAQENLKGYVTRTADWRVFSGELEDRLADAEWEDMAPLGEETVIDRRVTVLMGAIKKAAEVALQRRKARARPVPWWTPALTQYKREYYRARRRCQECRDEGRRPALLEEARHKHKIYRNGVRLQKRRSWDEFIVQESEKNPWGIPYRVALGKVKRQHVMAALRVEDAQVTTQEDNARVYINYTYPRDDPSQDTEEDGVVRRTTVYPPGTDLCPPWDIWDLRLAVDRQRTRRAPGLDGIDAAILKKSVPLVEEELLSIFNECLDRGHFPTEWKVADLRLLYKGGGKDKESPKAYRPICLLPVVSKVLERLILNSLKTVLTASSHPRQFGSTRGRGTTDALLRVRRDMEGRAEKYVMLLLFDISSAFDSVWWPSVLQRLQEFDTPSNLYSLVSGYLSNRRVIIRGSYYEVEEKIERGCPQGSVLGPALWKLVFDQLLGELEANGFLATAYVDDLAVIVAADSRARVKAEAERCSSLVGEWCVRKKLSMASAKTQAMLLRGVTDRARPIILNIGETRVRLGEEVTYLGVKIRRRFDVTPHLAYLKDRVTLSLNGLSKIGGAFWGLRYPATMTIYKGVVLGILRYASPAWSENLTQQQKKRLATVQRLALLRVTRAYRTVSHEAVQVLAGAMPLDLILKEDRLRFLAKRQGLEVLPEGLRRKIGETPDLWSGVVREDCIEEWNGRWETSLKGATLRKYFPTVRSRLSATWVLPDYWVSQILTGHGGFRAKLRDHGKDIDPRCPSCGVPETAEHVVLSCSAMDGHRARLARYTGLYALSEEDLPRLMEEEKYPYFKEFIYAWKEVVGPSHFTLGRARAEEPTAVGV